MIKKLISWVGGAMVVIAIGAVALVYFLSPDPEQPSKQNQVTLPGSQNATTTFSQEPRAFTIKSYDGSLISTKDFIQNGITIKDEANPGQYLLAGDLGYCVTDVTRCQAGGTTDFNILYNSADYSFIIALRAEPLGEIRRSAEEYLVRSLGISQKEMCRLNYEIGPTVYVNSYFAGKNLGFSFCPGAVKLPD